ncbi:hypothetical protein D3C87_2105950 [compost metagenome]
MLGARIDDRHRHLDRPESRGNLRELMRFDPLNIFQGFVDGIVAFFPGRVT